MTHPTPRHIAIAGATGLVGQHLLQIALHDESVEKVHLIGRRAPALSHPKIVTHVVDFKNIPALPRIDEVYLAIGTTIKVAGSKEAFRAIDFDANLAVAKAAVSSGATTIGLVSAIGADANSSIFYNKVKGELEEAILKLNATTVIIARPSLLLGDRKSLNQPLRTGEHLAQVLAPILRFILPPDYRPIAAAQVARALLDKSGGTHSPKIMLSGELQSF